MARTSPSVVILARPNGAGKSTAAPTLLKGALGVMQFVNADTIARGLAGFDPDDAALVAARIMLERIRELTTRGVNFAIETTLASRSLAAWLRTDAAKAGYQSQLLYLWLPTSELAIGRVRERVARGGHGVPEETIRRRYALGLDNLFNLYQPIVTSWRVYNNEASGGARLIASGGTHRELRVRNEAEWRLLLSQVQR